VWYKRFQGGREDVEDDECSGRPSKSIIHENVNEVEKMVMNDRRITIREVADEVGKSIGSCHNIFSNVLGMKRVAAKFIPKLLNFVVACSYFLGQKQHRSHAPSSIFPRYGSV
jgi:hypothetical protein